ncbi:helix-turn-helix transcriptional regulator [Streptosporangium sp. NPDC000239]|uniref:helix-turn-helix transcriptional regulator n=1 Tax=unclassified Streptosporangium TaxID=2632669 RepID=UPI0033249267
MSRRELRGRRMNEPDAAEVYEAARLAYELGKVVRAMREERGWSQDDLARAARMTRTAVARFEAGVSIPTLPILDRLARALDAELEIRLAPRAPAA